MAGYAKLFSSILTSTVWGLPDATLRVWIAMLASADQYGVVEGSVPGFARVACVSREQMEEALRVFHSPDPDSRTQEHEGRRLETIPGGWLILNYVKYRGSAQMKDGSRAPYHRAWRAKRREAGELPPQPGHGDETAGRAAAARRWEQAQAARDGTVPLEGLSESEKIVELARRLKAKADERADEEAE